MKKFLVILLCAVSVCGSVFLLGSCNDQVDKIQAYCPIDSAGFEMPFKPIYATTFGKGCDFWADKSLGDLQRAVDDMNIGSGSVDARVYRHTNSLLITLTTDDGYAHYYLARLLLTVSERNEFYYDFESPKLYGENTHVLFPMHLYDTVTTKNDAGKDGTVYADDLVLFHANETYKIQATVQEFAEFYENTNFYQVETVENRLIVTFIDVSKISEKNPYYAREPFVIEFETKDDGFYATYRL